MTEISKNTALSPVELDNILIEPAKSHLSTFQALLGAYKDASEQQSGEVIEVKTIVGGELDTDHDLLNDLSKLQASHFPTPDEELPDVDDVRSTRHFDDVSAVSAAVIESVKADHVYFASRPELEVPGTKFVAESGLLVKVQDDAPANQRLNDGRVKSLLPTIKSQMVPAEGQKFGDVSVQNASGEAETQTSDGADEPVQTLKSGGQRYFAQTNPVHVAIMTGEGGLKLIARLAGLLDREREDLKDEIDAMLASYGLKADAVILNGLQQDNQNSEANNGTH